MSTTDPPGAAAREHRHHHDRRCYWDHTRCGWVCPPAAAPPDGAPAAEPVPVPERLQRTAEEGRLVEL